MVNKRRDAKIVYHKTPSIARRPTRRRSPADLEDANLETLVNDSIPVDMKKGDADGMLAKRLMLIHVSKHASMCYRRALCTRVLVAGLAYLDRLQVLIRPNKMPRL